MFIARFVANAEDKVVAKVEGKSLISYVVLLMMFIAMFSFAQGGYMLAKAHVAQYLLSQAWQTNTNQHTENGADLQNEETNKPWPWADFYPIAKLSFDRLDKTHIVLNNDSGQALAFGPGLNQFQGYNGESSSTEVVVISAHNDTHFSILNELRLNDTVSLTLKSGIKQTFNVNKLEVIDLQTEQLVIANEVSQENRHTNIYSSINIGINNKESKTNKPYKELVLVTCYPFGGASSATSLRYVVYLS